MGMKGRLCVGGVVRMCEGGGRVCVCVRVCVLVGAFVDGMVCVGRGDGGG